MVTTKLRRIFFNFSRLAAAASRRYADLRLATVEDHMPTYRRKDTAVASRHMAHLRPPQVEKNGKNNEKFSWSLVVTLWRAADRRGRAHATLPNPGPSRWCAAVHHGNRMGA